MSSDEKEIEQKKRRIERACDNCRKKKIRCDGMQGPSGKCSHCKAFKFKCTYVEEAKKRGPPKAYVKDLEERLRNMEALLKRMSNNETEQSGLAVQSDSLLHHGEEASPSGSGSGTGNNNATTRAPSLAALEDNPEPSDDEASVLLGNLSLNSRFFGRSSEVSIVSSVLDIHDENATGQGEQKDRLRFQFRRPGPWDYPSWQVESRITTGIKYPEPDLLDNLVDLFFEHYGLIFPVLHEPIFKRELEEEKHLHDMSFSAVVLGVCACASRMSDDPRCLADGSQDKNSMGWRWYNQLQIVADTALFSRNTNDLQVFALRSMFLLNASTLQAAWTMTGIGLRMSQSAGVHRCKRYLSTPTVEGELQKRAFWAMICMDRTLSSVLGRSCAMQSEDFDLPLPVDCDEEFWQPTDGTPPFTQPQNRPSRIAHFIHIIKLNQILAFALRSIYSIRKGKVFLGFVGPDWEQNVAAELDSALNKWFDAIPLHLRWDPNRQSNGFFHAQSASLVTSYYLTQISVHRPFMMRPGKNTSPLSFPSTVICTNAARSAVRVIEAFLKSPDVTRGPPMFLQPAAFTSSILLLLNIYSSKRMGIQVDATKDLRDIRICMDWIKAAEKRWYVSGRAWGVLDQLVQKVEKLSPRTTDGVQNVVTQETSYSLPNNTLIQPQPRPQLPVSSKPPPPLMPFSAQGHDADIESLQSHQHGFLSSSLSGVFSGHSQSHLAAHARNWQPQNPTGFSSRPIIPVPSHIRNDFLGEQGFMHSRSEHRPDVSHAPVPHSMRYGVSSGGAAYDMVQNEREPGSFAATQPAIYNGGMFGEMDDSMVFDLPSELFNQWGADAEVGAGTDGNPTRGGMDTGDNLTSMFWGMPSSGSSNNINNLRGYVSSMLDPHDIAGQRGSETPGQYATFGPGGVS